MGIGDHRLSKHTRARTQVGSHSTHRPLNSCSSIWGLSHATHPVQRAQGLLSWLGVPLLSQQQFHGGPQRMRLMGPPGKLGIAHLPSLDEVTPHCLALGRARLQALPGTSDYLWLQDVPRFLLSTAGLSSPWRPGQLYFHKPYSCFLQNLAYHP